MDGEDDYGSLSFVPLTVINETTDGIAPLKLDHNLWTGKDRLAVYFSIHSKGS